MQVAGCVGHDYYYVLYVLSITLTDLENGVSSTVALADIEMQSSCTVVV